MKRRKYVGGAQRISLHMPTRMKDALDLRAASTGRTQTDIIHAALRRELDLDTGTPPAPEKPADPTDPLG